MIYVKDFFINEIKNENILKPIVEIRGKFTFIDYQNLTMWESNLLKLMKVAFLKRELILEEGSIVLKNNLKAKT